MTTAGAARPLVSVVITNYNYARFLGERFQSILAQTCRDMEIIFADDCSTDDSVAMAEAALAPSGLPYRILRNERNSGNPFVQWNRGLREARGEFVWIAESDDFCEPTLLAELLRLARRNERIGIAYCQTQPVDVAGQRITEYNYIQYTDFLDRQKWLAEYVNHGRHEVEQYLCRLCTIINVSMVLFRRAHFLRAGYVDPRYLQAGDWISYIKILEHADIAYTPQVLNSHRIHPRKNTVNTVTNIIYFRDLLNIIRYTWRHFEIPPTTRELQFQHALGQWNDHYNGPYGRIPARNNLKLLGRMLRAFPRHPGAIFRQYRKTLAGAKKPG